MLRKLLVFLVFWVFTSPAVYAQLKASDFFKDGATAVWYGFDFSHARYIGAMTKGAGEGFISSREFKNFIIPQLNGLVIKEREKYRVDRIFSKPEIGIDTSEVNHVNSLLDEKAFQTYDTKKFQLDTSQIKVWLDKYSFRDRSESFGIIVFVETLNKINKEGTFYLTVFDLKNKNPLFSVRLEGAMGGGGLKNFCAGAIHDMFRTIESSEYSKWKKKYSRP